MPGVVIHMEWNEDRDAVEAVCEISPGNRVRAACFVSEDWVVGRKIFNGYVMRVFCGGRKMYTERIKPGGFTGYERHAEVAVRQALMTHLIGRGIVVVRKEAPALATAGGAR